MDRFKWVFAILSLYLFFFFVFSPNEVSWNVSKNQPYRAVTFMFSHNSFNHLVLNIASLILVALICYEVNISTYIMSIAYALGSLSAIPLSILFSENIIGGSSGIYAIIGVISQNLSLFKISKSTGVALFSPLVLFDFSQVADSAKKYHTLSFITGAIIPCKKSKKRVFLKKKTLS